MFLDARFDALEIQHVRLIVAVGRACPSAGSAPSSTAGCSSRGRTARDPLVGFGHSRLNRRGCRRPTRFQREFRRFQRYPWVANSRRGTRPTTAASRPATGPARRRVLPRAAPLPECRSSPPSCSTCRTCSLGPRFRLHSTRAPRVGPAQLRRGQPLHVQHACAACCAHQGRLWLTEVGGIVNRRRKGYTVKASPSRRRTPHAPPLPVRRAGAEPGGSSASTCTTGTRRRSSTAGTPRSSAPTASAVPRTRSCRTAWRRCGPSAAARCASPSSRTRTCRAAAGCPATAWRSCAPPI